MKSFAPHARHFRVSHVALATALVVSLPAHAAGTFTGQITGDGAVLVQAAPGAIVNGAASTGNAISSNFQGIVSLGLANVTANSRGDAGLGLVETTLTYRQQVTNPFDTPQNVVFNFVIPASRTGIDIGFGTNVQTFTAAASFLGEITWGGASAWRVSFGISGSGDVGQGGGGFSVTGPITSPSASGFKLGALQNQGVYVNSETTEDGLITGLGGGASVTSQDYTGSLELGVMEANQTLELVYTLSGSASFEGSYRDESAFSFDSYGGSQAGGFDPFGIQFTPDTTGTGVMLSFSPAAVPEPGTYALMLGGIAGLLAWSGRRQRQAGGRRH